MVSCVGFVPRDAVRPSVDESSGIALMSWLLSMPVRVEPGLSNII